MAERSLFKKNLRYHRLVVLGIVLISIWVQYEFNSGNWSYQNGQPKINGQKINGKDEGVWTWFYPNGKKQMEGNFTKGKRNGLWVVWDSSGNKLSESNYLNDKLNGNFTRWYSNGKIESQGTYSNDQLVSVQRFDPGGSRLDSKP